MPTPRDLDPKFEKTTPPEENQTEENQAEENQSVKDIQAENDEPMIVHQVKFQDENGVWQVREHRVAVKDWPAYEKEHGF